MVVSNHFIRFPPGAAPCRADWRETAGKRCAPAVVLLYGIATTSGLMWFAAMAQLGSEFRVLVPDLRGHGRSACEGRFRLADAADDVIATLDAIGIDRAIFFARRRARALQLPAVAG